MKPNQTEIQGCAAAEGERQVVRVSNRVTVRIKRLPPPQKAN